MTNESASRANEDLRPVQDWENRAVNGMAHSVKRIFEEDIESAKKLRERQEAYEKSLPKDPVEALRAIVNTLDSMEDLDSRYYPIKASIELLYELACKEGVFQDTEVRHSVYWLLCKAKDALCVLEAEHTKARAIARQFCPHHTPFEA